MELSNYRDLQKQNSEKFETPDVPELEWGSGGSYQYVPKGASLTDERIASSFGDSRFDTAYYQGMSEEDINEGRFQGQSAVGQVTNALAKAGVLAGTTALDGIVGTPMMLLSMLDYVQQAGENFSWGELLNAGVNNPVSSNLQKINEWSESAIPNYYSQKQIENRENGQWYKNVLTTNFWADGVLKNMGFMIGAAVAGKVNAGMLSKAMGMQEARQAFKGLILNNSDDLAKTANAFRSGDLLLDSEKLTDALKAQAKSYAGKSKALQITASTLAAAGEGRIEAINNSQDFINSYTTKLDRQFQARLGNIEDMVAEEHPEWFSLQGEADSEGNMTSYYRVPSEEAVQEIQKRRDMLAREFETRKAELHKNAATVANMTFGLNLPLLTLGDMWAFGRYLLSDAEKAGTRGLAQYLTGELGDQSASRGAKALAKADAIKNTLWEGLGEEMLQGSISKGAGYYGLRDQLDMFGSSIDPEASQKGESFMNALLEGMKDTYLNTDGYEEGFAGVFGAALGIPGIGVRSNGKRGLVWQNQLRDGIREANDNYKKAEELAGRVNARIQSPEFQNLYSGLRTHMAIDQDKSDDSQAANIFMLEQDDFKQVVADAEMMAQAGKLDEYTQLISDLAGEVTAEDIADARQASIDKNTGTSPYDSMSDEQMGEKLKENGERMVSQLKMFTDANEAIETLYGEGVDDNVKRELAWKMANATRLEQAGQEKFKTVVNRVQNYLSRIEEQTGQSIPFLHGNYQEVLDQFTTEEATLLSDIYRIISDNSITETERIQGISDRIAEQKAALTSEQTKLKTALQDIENELANQISLIDTQYSHKVENAEEGIKRAEEERDRVKAIVDRVSALEDSAKTKSGKDAKALNKAIADLKESLNGEPSLDDLNKALENARLALKYVNDLSEGEKDFRRTNAQERKDTAQADYEVRESSILAQIEDLKQQLDGSFLGNPMDEEMLRRDLDDLIKIQAARQHFINLYTSLSKDTEGYGEYMKAMRHNVNAVFNNSKLREMVRQLSEAKSLQEFTQILSEMENARAGIESMINKGDNEQLKKWLKDTIRLENASGILNKLVKNSRLSDSAKESVINIANDAMSNAESYESFVDTFFNTDGIPDADVVTFITNIRDEFNRQMESAETTVKDGTKASAQVETVEGASTGEDSGGFDFGALGEASAETEAEEKGEEKSKENSESVESKPEPVSLPDDIKGQETPAEPESTTTTPTETPESASESAESAENAESSSTPSPLTPTPTQDNEGDADTDTGTQEVVSVDWDAYVSFLHTQTPNQLSEIADGNIANRERYTDEELENFRKLAEIELAQRRAGEAANSASEGSVAEEAAPEPPSYSDASEIGSETEYRYDVLERGGKDSTGTERQVGFAERRKTKVVDQLTADGAFSYVGTGRLAEKLAKDPKAVIRPAVLPEYPGRVVLVVELAEGEPSVSVRTINGKQYQIVGILPANSAISKKTVSEKTSKAKDMLSYVAEINLEVSKWRSGSRVKETDSVPANPRTDVDRGFLSKPGLRFALGVVDADGDVITRPGVNTVRLNRANANDRAGSVYLYVRGVDGVYYPRAISIKQFNSTEYSESEYGDTVYFKAIKDRLAVLADPSKPLAEKLKAKGELNGYLVIPADHTLNVTKNGVTIQNYNDGGNVLSEGTVEERTNQLLEAVQAQNYRFRIGQNAVKDDMEVQKFIDSKLFYTDLVQPTNEGFSFYVREFTGERHTPESTYTPRTNAQKNSFRTVQRGTERFRIEPESGRAYDSKGNEITDPHTVEELFFMDKVVNKKVYPVPGNSTLFIGTYTDGGRFATDGNRVVTDSNEIARLEESARKLHEKKSGKAAVQEEAAAIRESTVPEPAPGNSFEGTDSGFDFGAMEAVESGSETPRSSGPQSESPAPTVSSDKDTVSSASNYSETDAVVEDKVIALAQKHFDIISGMRIGDTIIDMIFDLQDYMDEHPEDTALRNARTAEDLREWRKNKEECG